MDAGKQDLIELKKSKIKEHRHHRNKIGKQVKVMKQMTNESLPK